MQPLKQNVMKPPGSENLISVCEPVQHLEGWSPISVEVKGKFLFELPFSCRIQKYLLYIQCLLECRANQSLPFSSLSKVSQRNASDQNIWGIGGDPRTKQSAHFGSLTVGCGWSSDLSQLAREQVQHQHIPIWWSWVFKVEAEPVFLPEGEQ